ncbi:MAG: hypothetical protein HY390_05320, partial [Deltaproteobacteria bacterium]|nr:hypothetical protein [Deltaproteobacteria bacterium]
KKFFKKLYDYWMIFAKVLAYINTTLLLSVLYFLLLPWIAFIQRLSSKQDEGYWQVIEQKTASQSHHHFQF